MKPRRDARLVPVALVVYGAAGIQSAEVLDAREAILLGLCGVVFVWGVRWGRGAALATLAFVVASGVTALHLGARLEGGVGEALASGEEVVFTGTVTTDPRPMDPGPWDEERWRLTVRIDAIEGGGPSRAAVTIVGGGAWGEVETGERVRGRGRVDNAGAGREVGIAWNPVLVETTPAMGVDGLVGDLREGFRKAVSGLPDDVRHLTVGMTIGDTSGMSAIQEEEMRIAGLTHLTAVSGAQFAILALAISTGVKTLGWNRRLRASALVVAILGFVSLVRPEPSVLRAAWMGGILALALWCGRPGQALPALSTAVTGLLLADPFLSLSYGFALSVAATAGIVLWSPVVAAALTRVVPSFLARALSIPIAAQVCCTPILVLFTSGMGSYSVLANLVSLPFAAVVTVLGLAAVVVCPLCEPAGVACAWCAGQAARPVAWAAHTAATLPGGWLSWPSGVTGGLLAATVSVSLMAATTVRRVPGWARLALLMIVLALVAASPGVRQAIREPSAPEDWAVAVCDVGQGDMILIRAGPTSAVVIDVGPEGGNASGCLARHRVETVPLLVITHPHSDHDGEMERILGRMDVGEAWISEPGFLSGEREGLEAAGIVFGVPETGRTVRVGEATLTVWHRGEASAQTDSEVNNSSLVVWGESGGVTFLSLGDLEDEGQTALAGELGPLTVDVLKVAHHGSASQDPGLLSSVVFDIAVISVGEGNPYGHPATSTVEAIGHARSFRTDECGDIDVSRRGGVVVIAGCR
ncbi:MAG: ComEC/Rec2 family competence protein [Demequinaceae bacterium]|nr:ComEC/Rec2 family competence protein [Demequinaceae bacterium]